jgi:hypothetical protein
MQVSFGPGAGHLLVLGAWCVLLVRQCLRLPAVGFAQLNRVWSASTIALPELNQEKCKYTCPQSPTLMSSDGSIFSWLAFSSLRSMLPCFCSPPAAVPAAASPCLPVCQYTLDCVWRLLNTSAVPSFLVPVLGPTPWKICRHAKSNSVGQCGRAPAEHVCCALLLGASAVAQPLNDLQAPQRRQQHVQATELSAPGLNHASKRSRCSVSH